MADDVSASSFRSDRMSHLALALAALLHALAALALWRMSQDRPLPPPVEDPIVVTVEQPKPPAPLAEPLAPAALSGLLPTAPTTADKPTQVPPPPDQPKKLLPVPQPPLATATELPKPALPPPAKLDPPPHSPPLRPSPLTTATRQRLPAVTHAEPPSLSPFVNPADARNRARASDNYLWEVGRKLSGYRYMARAPIGKRLTVVRIVVARDGRLLSIDVIQSSGFPELDGGVVAGVRGGSPYTPLPPEIQGDRATFVLPLISTLRP